MHKHFLIALLVGAGTLLAASCSEESATVRQRTLEVVSSDTNFPVDGGSRTVTTVRAATTAYAQDKWAQVRVENGQVIVKTDVNTDEQGSHCQESTDHRSNCALNHEGSLNEQV